MGMLSEFLHFKLIDQRERRAHLIDLAVDLGSDYPPVTQLVLQQRRQQPTRLPWDAVAAIDWQARTVRVTDLDAATFASLEALDEAVLLKRDVLDAMVLDLAHHTATLTNDLALAEERHQLHLRSAAVNPWAMVRRLSRGFFGRGSHQHLLDWKDVEFLRGDPQAVHAGRQYHRRVTRLTAGEIARLTAALPYLHAAELLSLIPAHLAAEVLELTAPERQLQVFEEFAEDEVVRLLALMAPASAADLLGRLHSDMAGRYLARLPDATSQRLIELLRYPVDVAGGIMTNDVPMVSVELTVEQARDALRDQLQGPDFVYYIYVVDDGHARRLRGVVTVRDLLVADPAQPLAAVMRTDLVTIDPPESARDAAQRVVDNQLAALPVVGDDHRLLGAITADAAVAQLAPRSWRAQAPRVFS